MAARGCGWLCLVSVLLAGLWATAGARPVAALEVGEEAPDFALPSTTGEKISLSEFRGKKLVLVQFYLADFGAT